MNYLSDKELKALFSVIESPRDRAIFTVAYWRGLRASEIGLLTLDGLDMERGRLRVVRLKGSYSGEFRLSPDEVKALKAWLRVRGKEPGPLFPSRRGGSLSRAMIQVLMLRYGTAAGLSREKCHPHILKHTIATHLMDIGLGIEEVQDWLGHAYIKNTQVYAKVTNRHREEVAERVYGKR